MASALRTIKYLFLMTAGSLAGMAIAIILRPSYPPDPSRYAGEVDKPSVYMMFENGIPGKTPTDRLALIYLVTGFIVGALAGFILSRLSSRKRTV